MFVSARVPSPGSPPAVNGLEPDRTPLDPVPVGGHGRLANGWRRLPNRWRLFLPLLAISCFAVTATPVPVAPGASATGNGAVRSAIIFYTAGTGGYLEPLRREGVAGGGLARRATLIAAQGSPLIVEAGGIFDPAFVHEARRARVVLECLVAMDYDFVHLAAADLGLGPEAIAKAFEGLPLTWVATNVRPAAGTWPAARSMVREVGWVTILVAGVVPPSEVPQGYVAVDPAEALGDELAKAIAGKKQTAPLKVVVLSDLTSAENEALVRAVPEIEVIISTRANTREKLRRATVLPRTDGGMTVGRIQLGEQRLEGSLLPLDLELAEDSAVRTRLTDYYRAVAAASPPPAPLDPEAGAPGLRYVGARICAECHRGIYEGWAETPHARAYETLVDARRHELPECVLCHATGVGHPAGFTSDRTRPHFAGVQCESCHGAGSVHSRLPARGTIRRHAPAAVCLRCHTDSQSPGFRADPAGYQARVVHREEVEAKAPEPPAPRAERAKVELYIMGLCPYGGTAAEDLAAVRDSMGQAIEVEVHYIVRSTSHRTAAGAAAAPDTRDATAIGQLIGIRAQLAHGGEACVDDDSTDPAPGSDGDAALAEGFSSLHGPEEVIEDLRQIVIAERYPARVLEYIGRRSAEPDGDWRALATRLGIDPAMIESRLASARPRLAEDAARARAAGIVASPTLRLNGAALDPARVGAASGPGRVIRRAICAALLDPPAACAALPACEHDADCRAPGREGRCAGAGPQARCVFSPAPRVTLHVLNDPRCGLCSPIDVVAGARDLFANLEVVAHDVSAGAGGSWIEAFDIQSVPAFAFVGAESSVAFPTLRNLVLPGKGGSLLDPAVVRGPLHFRRKARPGAVDIFIEATGEESLYFLRSLAEISKTPEGGPALASAEIKFHPMVESGPPGDPATLRLVQRGKEGYLVPESALPQLKSRLGPEDLAEARRQACIATLGLERILDYMLDRAAHEEVGVGDWRSRCLRLGLDPAQVALCAGGGEADERLAVDRRIADSLGVRAPAAVAANRLRFDGLGPWNQGAFVRALTVEPPGSGASPP